jgi:hypothetical protein
VTRLLGVVGLAATMAIATLAAAQPRRPGRGKPSPARVDAGASVEITTTDAASEPDTEEAPVPTEELFDGGLRPSPLNPRPEELPSHADAGAPVDYDRLLADIAALRARVAAVSANLYHSRIRVAVKDDAGQGRLGRLTVSLDDGVVFTSPASFNASDMTTVYEQALAPGRHAVTLDVERRDARGDAFRASQRSRFTVEVPRDHRLDVEVRIDDDSSMAKTFPSDRSGKYDLRFRVKAVAKPARP